MTFGEVKALHEAVRVAREVVVSHARCTSSADAVAWVMVAADHYNKAIDGMPSEKWLRAYLESLPDTIRRHLIQVLADSAGSTRLERLMGYVRESTT